MPRTQAERRVGFLAVDKAPGWTSHDVVARVRRLAGVRRVGHAGTLDPFATGLLVVGVGKATRLIQYVQNTTKTYEAVFKLGTETDTFDPEGAVTARFAGPPWPSLATVARTLRNYEGSLDQIPPAHSAVHVNGKRAYELARSGEQVELPARPVTIHALAVRRYDPPLLELSISCSTGTYIRALARDIGRELGVYAHCRRLRRTASGLFQIDSAISLQEFDPDSFRARWDELALPADAAVRAFQPVHITEAQSAAWYHGQSLGDVQNASGDDADTLVRVYSAGGEFAGLGRFETGSGLRPALVFTTD